MNKPLEQHHPQAEERAIRALSEQSGVELVEVRALFHHERERLGLGAKVGSYLAVLTASNVRGRLRRLARLGEQARHDLS